MRILFVVAVIMSAFASPVAHAHGHNPDNGNQDHEFRDWCDYQGWWWCKNHDANPGRDEDRSEPDPVVDTPADPPVKPDPPKKDHHKDRGKHHDRR